MTKKNIWSTLSLDENKPNILKSLNALGEPLSASTKGYLYAEINPVDTYDEKTLDLGVVYYFYIIAPYLANYRINIFRVAETPNSIQIYDVINNSPPVTVKDLNDLDNKVENIIQTPKIKELIQNLYASSIELRKKSS